MVFSSSSFLFMFFPLCLAAYFLLKNRPYRNAVLLLFSLFFYAWGGGLGFLLLLVAAVAVAYLGGLLLVSLAAHGRPRLRRSVFVATVSLLLLNLFVFKYLNFTVRNLSSLFSLRLPFPELVLPIGISFYTFQVLSYVIDLYRGLVPVQKNPLYLLLYVSFFPQLIAGPIVRYETIQEEITSRRENLDDVVYGLKRFLIGLAKKLILANRVAAISEIIYAGDPALYGSLMYWLAALAYTLQIYFDFSGYSDMAIGIGRIFGFHFLENFDYPYLSCSVTEFWRRWHISLSSWFRDYVYIPLGGNRVSKPRWIFNILLVWMLTGFWHGAEWNFLLWGLYYGFLLLLEKLVLLPFLSRLPKFLSWLYTFVIVNVGWVIFNLTDFSKLRSALSLMFRFQPTHWLDMFAADISITTAFLYIPLGLLCCFPLFRKCRPVRGAFGELVSCGAYLALLAVCVAYLVSSTYNPFIYFRF